MRVWVGIDVGLDGAVAVIPETGDPRVFDTPWLQVGKRREYDFGACANVLVGAIPGVRMAVEGFQVLVGIERASAFPKQGVVSVFSFGKGFGMWVGICAGLGLPFEIVSPQRWQAAMIPGEKSKDASRMVAKRLFPMIDLSKKRHHGRSDAILISEYLRRLRSGGIQR